MTSSPVTPSCSASSCTIGMPRSPSWAMTSPWTLFEVATLLKIAPISPIDVPPIVAASATRVRVRSSSLPGFTPAATAPAAVPAASSRPNAVPWTAASELSMMACTLAAECPRPVSFALAWSMPLRRWKPFTNEVPTRATPAAVPARTPFLAQPPSTPPTLPRPLEPRSACLPDFSAASPTSLRAASVSCRPSATSRWPRRTSRRSICLDTGLPPRRLDDGLDQPTQVLRQGWDDFVRDLRRGVVDLPLHLLGL